MDRDFSAILREIISFIGEFGEIRQSEGKIGKVSEGKVRYICGVDVAYREGPENGKNVEIAKASAVIFDTNKMEVVESRSLEETVRMPYIPGFLGFREAPIMAHLLCRMESPIDLVMVDGHGIMHPYLVGSAVHLGILLDYPTIGVAKCPFYADPLNLADLNPDIRNLDDISRAIRSIYVMNNPYLGPNPIGSSGSRFPADGGLMVGIGCRTRPGGAPVYISPGYQTTILEAVKTVFRSTIDHRLPEPLFLADKASKSP